MRNVLLHERGTGQSLSQRQQIVEIMPIEVSIPASE